MVYSISLILLLGVQDRGLSKDISNRKVYKSHFLLRQSQNSLALPVVSLSFGKQKINKAIIHLATFSPASIFCNDEQAQEVNRNIINKVILLQFCSWFFQFNHFIACLWRKSAINNESHFPFNHRQIQSANKRDNPLFSLMSPCIAMVERKKKS